MYDNDTNGTKPTDRFRFPIEREADESVKAFDACVFYLKIPPTERTILKAYRLRSGRPDAKQTPSSWKKWFKEFDWPGRADKYDLWNIQATTDMIAEVRQESISDVKYYFDAINSLIIKDINANIRLFGFLEKAMDQKEMLAQRGQSLTPREIKDLAEARLCILTGTQKSHQIALDILGYSSLPIEAEAEAETIKD